MDHWDRIESLEISFHICSPLIFNKGAKTVQWDEVFLTSGAVLGQLDIHMQKSEFGLLPLTIYKK